jgi:hypothetical protein
VPLESEAKGTDAFTTQQQTTHSQRNRSFSSRAARKPSNGGPEKPDNSGSGGDDDNGMLQYPKAESVQETENRVDKIDEYIARMEESSDSEEEECEAVQQNKAGFKELPDGKNFSYNMEQGRGLKKQAKRVWKNDKAKQEVLRMLNRFEDENANIEEKSLKGFKNLTELKNSGSGPRILIYRGKNEQPTVIGFCMRDDLDATLDKLKGKYN